MMDNNEYFALFYKIASETDCDNMNQVAFEQTEAVHWGMYGCHKFSKYTSFRSAKTRYIRRLVVKNHIVALLSNHCCNNRDY